VRNGLIHPRQQTTASSGCVLRGVWFCVIPPLSLVVLEKLKSATPRGQCSDHQHILGIPRPASSSRCDERSAHVCVLVANGAVCLESGDLKESLFFKLGVGCCPRQCRVWVFAVSRQSGTSLHLFLSKIWFWIKGRDK